MLEIRPNCECCDADIAANNAGAFICSFECTFCRACANDCFALQQPNCLGELVRRPARPLLALQNNRASIKRITNKHEWCKKQR